MLYERVVEIDERVDADGRVLTPLDEAARARGARRTRSPPASARSPSCCMHGYRFTEHERRVAEIARDIGFTQISTSHGASPLMKLVSPRRHHRRRCLPLADPAPLRRRRWRTSSAATRLMFMQSNGGLTDARLFQGKDSILSGPAGGVVGMVRTAQLAGFAKVIGFDMGGTSTDVSHFDGEYERAFETQVAGVRMRAPMMRIHTVAAGGGSILHFDGARFRVGPDSAGADPGPACYRRGGPLTVTDANVLLGRIQPAHFPRVFGPNGDEPLDADVVRREVRGAGRRDRRRDRRRRAARRRWPTASSKIAVENMANAIKQISVQRGYDVTEYVLNCFGGAGGQHACRIADTLGMTRVLIHPLAGVLSAYGMGLADLRALREQAVEAVLSEAAMPDLRRAARRARGRRARRDRQPGRVGSRASRVVGTRAPALPGHRHAARRCRSRASAR